MALLLQKAVTDHGIKSERNVPFATVLWWQCYAILRLFFKESFYFWLKPLKNKNQKKHKRKEEVTKKECVIIRNIS